MPEPTVESLTKELNRVREWGLLPAGSDFLGMWLANALKGKKEYTYVDAEGKEFKEFPANILDASLPLKTVEHSNSMEEPFVFGCCHAIEIHWDQWVRVGIKCNHGTFEEVSDFLNFTEALMRAIVKFNSADHPSGANEEEDEEEDEGDEEGDE